MIDITHKYNTLREATASATVKVSKTETIAAVRDRKVPKGDVLEMAKTAGLFGVKKTAEMIPDCHPMPVESTVISYELNEMTIDIQVAVKTIYKTGVEVEAMHGASVVALTIYDMLKPIDKGVSIENIRLVQKSGGKSTYNKSLRNMPSIWVVVCNDRVHSGEKEDRAGQNVTSKLKFLELDIADYDVIPQDSDAIKAKVEAATAQNIDLLIFTGGTGLGENDVLPETIRPLLSRHIPGMEEAIRTYGQERTPYAMVSRSVTGVVDKTLVIGLPGSSNGAKESMDALFPVALHAITAIQQPS